VVESSHWPIISFFKVAASCARDGIAAASTKQATSAKEMLDFIGEPFLRSL
jgi:hypothetical protein